MTIIKLPNVTDTYTGDVISCEEVPGQFGAQVKFTFRSLDLLFLPADTAHRQLLHAGFPDAGGAPPKAELTAVQGNRLTFSRAANKTPGAKPYWNIELAAPAEARPRSQRLTGPDAVPGEAPSRYAEPLPPPPTDEFSDLGSEPPEASDFPVAGQPAREAPTPREAAYFALARRVATFQIELQREYDIPCDMSAVNAMTATLWINRGGQQ